jgi:hypothetical protein
MRCQYCGGEFEAKTSRRQFCSAKCRAAAWQLKRSDELAMVEEQLARALTRVRALRGAANARGG